MKDKLLDLMSENEIELLIEDSTFCEKIEQLKISGEEAHIKLKEVENAKNRIEDIKST